MADPYRRYSRQDDEFNNSRGRSPSVWRSRSPYQRGSSSSTRYRRSPSRNAGRYSAGSQSPSRWRSPSRYRNRSPSPPPREQLSPRRQRSRSPPSNYTIESPESRRRGLLAEKVMPLETFHKLLLAPKSPWAKKNGPTPIPVPLTSNENTGDYQQKFEFWLAQRNVTLASFRDDVMLERSYRCGYAQWRVQKHYGQPSPASGKANSVYGRRRLRSRSPSWTRKIDEQVRKQYRNRSPEMNSVHQGESQNYRVAYSNNPKPESSRFYDVHRRESTSRRYNDENSRESAVSCKNCDRKLADLSRRVKQLERIVSRLDWPRAFNGTSASLCETNAEPQSSRGDSSATFIDLTDEMEVEPDSDPIQTETKGDTTAPDETHETQPKSVEITPSDSDANHEGPLTLTAVEKDEPITQPTDDIELKSPPELTVLINAYDQLNDQVSMKQREEQMVVADMESMIDEDEESSVELRSQIYELRDSIKKEKDKRDAAVAAIIVHAHAERREEHEQEFGKGTISGSGSEQDNLHEKCAGIAAKLAEKDKEIARLQKQLQSLSSLPVSTDEGDHDLGEQEAQELSSKIGLERASKTSLET